MFKQFFLSILLLLLVNICAAQQQAVEKTDSAKVYKDIEKFSKRNKFTKVIYGFIFRSTAPKKKTKKNVRLKQKYYNAYEGKVIRSITIITLDPFGFSVKDTVANPKGFLMRAGNSLHKKTLPIAIKNLLLFRKYDVFDSLKVKESERLIRSQKYVREVFLYPVITSKKSDSVDILIRVLDLWSILPSVGISPVKVAVRITERNFLGTGHQFQNSFSWNHTTGKRTFNTIYSIPNIRNSYITTAFQYYIDEENNFIKSIAVERKFYSPLAKWAGGAFVGQQFLRSDTIVTDSIIDTLTFKFNIQDYWLAREWQLFKGNSEEERTTNFVSAIRFLKLNYLETPFDSTKFYADQDFYLSGIGITTRKYFQDHYIFNFGVTEDVPEGRAYGIVGGYQYRNSAGRWYAGLRASWGKYHDFGYYSINMQLGGFIKSSQMEQGALNVNLIYFSNLLEIGNWKIRQFIKPEATFGIRRESLDRLTINDDYGLRGFKSDYVYGNSRLLLTFQTQSYAPWNILGFRFGPYFVTSFGMLSDDQTGFKRSRVYSLIGFGLLIKNEFLVFNTLQFSIVFYPSIPGSGNNIFKINSYKTTDFILPDFQISKPEIVSYQ
ncbi:MAG: hypothetical protein ABI723_07395 [Bacteroidia bacterium]